MTQIEDELHKLNTSVNLLAALALRQELRNSGIDQAKLPRLEVFLSESGFNGRQIATYLGKSPQAVSQIIKKYGKPVTTSNDE